MISMRKFDSFLLRIIMDLFHIRMIFRSFHRHLGQMWRQSNIQPIVYTLNSPSEKRYVQQALRTQYLTDSLRSEPYQFVKARK